MVKNRGATVQAVNGKSGAKPSLKISKIGMVTRDYRIKYPNRYRDFSYSFLQTLNLLDNERCDSVLFSLFSIIPRKGYDFYSVLKGLKKIKAVLVEEFQDGNLREAGRYVTFYRASSGWNEYELCQKFGTVTGVHKTVIDSFVQREVPKRIMGNCCVLICGETNGVKYSKQHKKIDDTFGLRETIPGDVDIILNPVHDRMTRFEMKLKRQFLSENSRWVISVWNKGKQNKNGKSKDGNGPAWAVFHDGNEIDVPRISNEFGVEIGTLNIRRA